MRIFELFYFVCIAGMVLAFFGPNLAMLNMPNIFDRYRYLLKHKLECNIRINGTEEEQTNSAAITVGSESSRPSPNPVSHLVQQIKSASSGQKTPASESLLQDTVDKIFKSKSLHKTLSNDIRNLTEHGNLKSIVDKISDASANAKGLNTMEDVADAVNKIFKQVQDLEDDNPDLTMRKMFEHLNERDEDSDLSNSE